MDLLLLDGDRDGSGGGLDRAPMAVRAEVPLVEVPGARKRTRGEGPLLKLAEAPRIGLRRRGQDGRILVPVDLDELEVHIRHSLRRVELVEVLRRGTVRGLVPVGLVEGESGPEGPLELAEGIPMEVVLRGKGVEECEKSRPRMFLKREGRTR